MVSDTDIVRRLTSVLRKADLSVATTAAIRKQLEKEFRVDLSDRKAFIREQVDLCIRSLQAKEEEVQEEGGEVDGEEVDGVAEEDAEEEQEEEQEPEPEEPEQEEEEDEEEEEEQGDEPEGGGGEDEEEVAQSRPAKRTRQSTHEPDSKRFKAKIDRAIKASLPKEKKKRSGGGGGLTKACGLSPELQAIIGEPELPRTQVVKQLWVYIRANELQDPENRRKILCNDQLRGLFGVDSTDIFKMNKLLSRHIWPLDKPAADGEAKPRKPKAEKAVTDSKSKNDRKENDKPKKESDRQKPEKKEGGRGRGSGLLPLSEALMEFLGTDEIEMEFHEVVKDIWDYIAANKLQDPADKTIIICDAKLQDLFGCETFVGFNLTKLLAPHMKG